MEQYQKNIAEAGSMLARLKKRINILALSRLGVILLGVALFFWVVRTESFWALTGVFFALLVAFALLVRKQSREEEKRERWKAFLAINNNEVQAAEGKPNLYDHGDSYRDPAHPYSDDLDIYGDHSLYELINRASTRQGRDRLAAYLEAPAISGAVSSSELILLRQEALRELAADREWCQQLQVDLFHIHQDGRDLKQILGHYVAGEQKGFGSKLLSVYVQVAPYLVLGIFALSYWMPSMLKFGVWLMIAHLLFSLGYAARVNQIGGKFDKISALLRTIAEALARVENKDWQSPLMVGLAAQVRAGGHSGLSVSLAIRRLGVLLEKLEYRLNMLVGAFMNMVFLWDFRQVMALQQWQSLHGKEVLDVLDVIGETEALMSLAVLRINHPAWCFPEIHPETARILSFREMNHPLIHPHIAVANSYAKEDHRIALITGSNMAGKSTFLRTVGINTVLALAGAPVCAGAMQVSVMYMISYMRIKDSLQESTSTFKAELDRMKMLLQTIEVQPASYFLIDEMLRGTNSVDKYRGSKAIIERLIQADATGMVATHDLQLSKLEEEHPGVIRNYHFDIQVAEGEMLFDYKLKLGECKIFNASLLLRGIGIEVGPA